MPKRIVDVSSPWRVPHPCTPMLRVPAYHEWQRSWGNVLYLQYPGLPEPAGWGGIILTGHFTWLSRAVSTTDYRTSLVGETERVLLLPSLTCAVQCLLHGGRVVWRMRLRESKREDGFHDYYGRTICRFLITLKVCMQPLKMPSTSWSFVAMSKAGSYLFLFKSVDDPFPLTPPESDWPRCWRLAMS